MRMRPFYIILALTAGLLAGCTVEGVIVQKTCRPTVDASIAAAEGIDSFVFRGPSGTSRLPVTLAAPDFWNPGQEGVCKFVLRDQQGNLHSQLVPPTVYARYQIGDYFSDLQTPVARQDGKDSSYEMSGGRAVRHRYNSHAKHHGGRNHRGRHKNAKIHKRASGKIARR